MIEFTVNIQPMGCVRMTQRGKWLDKRAMAYLSYKDEIGHEARQYVKEPFTGPVKAFITFYYPIPVSWSKVKKIKASTGELYPTVKPDLDNCVKGVYDALNKIAWTDDNLVVSTIAIKLYSEEPRINIRIEEVKAA